LYSRRYLGFHTSNLYSMRYLVFQIKFVQ
jgi:hypothetical protein